MDAKKHMYQCLLVTPLFPPLTYLKQVWRRTRTEQVIFNTKPLQSQNKVE
ncbi:hypothetical protein KFK09_014268 [Dendrobium nobile]|uniref:Uncharacterized protein n=1 Tax=Dendrobium nobile TaxID=94219 RepID=A0A8T3BB78_DENNO|nr:hypothetical protein KFK09_014268 [Dendrobium nobile]